MMRIGVISDTHGLLRPAVLGALANVEHIIHAGDIGSPAIVPQLTEIAPVTALRGNVDTQPWALGFPPQDVVALGGRTIYVIHDRGVLDLDPVAAGFDVVYLNLGSAGPRRFRLPIALAIVDLTSEVICPEIQEFVDQ